jgi:endonuclease III
VVKIAAIDHRPLLRLTMVVTFPKKDIKKQKMTRVLILPGWMSQLAAARAAKQRKETNKKARIQNAAVAVSIAAMLSAQCDPLSPAAATPELRERVRMSYSENSRKRPYSEMVGTTTGALRDDTRKVINVITDIASGPWENQRREELIDSILRTSEFQQMIEPPAEYKLLAAGVREKLAVLCADNLRATTTGRVAFNTVVEAVVAGITAGVNDLAFDYSR